MNVCKNPSWFTRPFLGNDMTFTVRLFLLVNLMAVSLCSAAEPEQSPAEMRKMFLQAEQLINQDRDAEYFALADTLKSYALYPYLQYQWQKNHLDDNNAVQLFLAQFPQSRYAWLLRQKWLLELGKKQQWPVFAEYYRQSDDAELRCYFAEASYHGGRQEDAIEIARQLWLSGKSQPAACDALFAILKTSALFNRDLVWQRLQAALRLDNTALAQAMIALLPDHEQADAQLWLKLHRQPALLTESGGWKQSPLAGLLFSHAIVRWLDNDPLPAMQTWDAEYKNFAIPADVVAETEKKLALALAFRRDSRAFQRLSQLADKDVTVREWRVRAALSQQNWSQALLAVDGLNDEEKRQDKWQYWLARALAETGQTEMSAGIYRQIAKNRSFYGFLAADRLRQKLNMPNQPLNIPDSEISRLQQTNEFQVTAELLAIDRRQEAKKQWFHAIAKLDQQALRVAAKLAQQWQWPAMAIFTIAKANDWDDMDLRFPLQYRAQIQEIAKDQQLDPALIFGLIRQESAFDELADSPAGAKGLMQLLPKTAQQIAPALKDNWSGDNSLFNPALNIRYGSYFYKKLLAQFNGNHFLTAAAYNAGPNRIRRWLPDSKPMPGDIWIETIPYKETRTYVASVLLYALIYQQRLQENGLKLSDLLHQVNPD